MRQQISFLEKIGWALIVFAILIIASILFQNCVSLEKYLENQVSEATGYWVLSSNASGIWSGQLLELLEFGGVNCQGEGIGTWELVSGCFSAMIGDVYFEDDFSGRMEAIWEMTRYKLIRWELYVLEGLGGF
jgi:hypothetical protein